MIRSNREDYPPLTGLTARVVRAHVSLNEALTPFAVVVIAATLLRLSSSWTVGSAVGFLTARTAHAGLYLLGITPWRSIAFYAGLLATLVFACQLPWPSLAI